MGLGAGVKADEISRKLKSARQDALRACATGRAVRGRRGRQVRELPLQRQHAGARRDAAAARRRMALHLGRHRLLRADRRPGVQRTRAYWASRSCRRRREVYRGEYLAASVLAAAEAGEQGLDLAALYAAEREAGGLIELVRRFAAERYDEGYERGLHDADAAAILEKLLALRATAGLLRVSPAPRALAVPVLGGLPTQRPARGRAGTAGPRAWPGCARRSASRGGGPARARAGAGDRRVPERALGAVGLSRQATPAGRGLPGRGAGGREAAVRDERAAVSLQQGCWPRSTPRASGGLRRRRARARARLRERFELVRAWLDGVRGGDAGAGQAAGAVEAAVLMLTDRKLDREVRARRRRST
jgi:hypothetical protein